MNSTIEIAVQSSWSLPVTTFDNPRRVTLGCSTASCGSLTPTSVTTWPASMITITPAVNSSQARVLSPSALVTGMIATTTVNRPMVLKILASAPIRSRCCWSRVRAGSSDQYGMSFIVQVRPQSR